MTNRYFNFSIKLERSAFKRVKIIVTRAYSLADDIFNGESDDRLRHNIDTETADWLNHASSPVNELRLSINEP